MQSWSRIIIGTAASLACVLATAAPSAAYYRETGDRAHDLAASGRCGGIAHTASVDIREIGAATYDPPSHPPNWRLRVTMRVADLRKPATGQQQYHHWAVYRDGDLAYVIRVKRWVKRNGKLGMYALLGANSVPVKVRGDTLTVWAWTKPGYRLRVKGFAGVEKLKGYRTVCRVSDSTRKTGPLPTYT
jgi:hypothetical protein